MTPDQFRAAFRGICQEAGGQTAWAKVNGFGQSYVSEVVTGRSEPSPRLLAVLGLRRVVSYEG